MTLDELKLGQKATVTRVDNEGPLAQRLMSLGLLEGTTVMLLRTALGGDPIEIDVMGYALSLRKAEARQIEICLTDK
jgi:ferrous iron transport protein A